LVLIQALGSRALTRTARVATGTGKLASTLEEISMAKIKYKAPKGYQDATTYLRVADAAAAIDFYATAFGAKEKYRLTMPGSNAIGHAELWFGNTCVMLADEFPDMGIVGPKTLGGVSAQIALYVADADTVFERAVAAGAKVKRPLSDAFYGDRTGQVEDPFGHMWSIQTRIEDVSPKKMQKRLDAMGARDVPPAAEPKAKSKAKPKAKTRAKRSN
jgi:PhnB protein